MRVSIVLVLAGVSLLSPLCYAEDFVVAYPHENGQCFPVGGSLNLHFVGRTQNAPVVEQRCLALLSFDGKFLAQGEQRTTKLEESAKSAADRVLALEARNSAMEKDIKTLTTSLDALTARLDALEKR